VTGCYIERSHSAHTNLCSSTNTCLIVSLVVIQLTIFVTSLRAVPTASAAYTYSYSTSTSNVCGTYTQVSILYTATSSTSRPSLQVRSAYPAYM
jgi:hypothetical protein